MDQQKVVKIVFEVSLIAALLLVLFIILIVYFRYKRNEDLREKKSMKVEFEKQLLQSQIEVQEATFSTLAQELHDNVGQLLSSAKMLLGLTQRKIDVIPDTLIIADETLGKAINEIRSLSKSLNKEWLEQFNFIENLRYEVSRINAANNLQLHFSHPDILLLKSGEQIILFRIVQEAIQNAIKHAHPKNIYINITSDDILTVSIINDGAGFNHLSTTDGMGILNMKHRTQLLGGSIEWKMLHKEGAMVIIKLPFKNDTHES